MSEEPLDLDALEKQCRQDWGLHASDALPAIHECRRLRDEAERYRQASILRGDRIQVLHERWEEVVAENAALWALAVVVYRCTDGETEDGHYVGPWAPELKRAVLVALAALPPREEP